MSVPYHAWTHRPKILGGTDPIVTPLPSFFRAIYQDTTGITGITTTLENLDWTWWQNQDSDVFQPLDSGGGDPGNGVGPPMRYVRLKPIGVYSFSLAVRPTTTLNMDGFSLYLSDDDTPWGFKESVIHGPAISTYEHGGWMVFHWERIYPYIDPFDSEFAEEIVYYPPDMAGGDSVEVYFQVAASMSSGSATVKQAQLDITYHYLEFPTDTSWPPPD